MLTKEEIEREATAWKRNGDSTGVINEHYLELCRLALLGLERDERAERIGRAVLLSFGYSPAPYRKWADALERHTLVTPARLLRAIADAIEEP